MNYQIKPKPKTTTATVKPKRHSSKVTRVDGTSHLSDFRNHYPSVIVNVGYPSTSGKGTTTTTTTDRPRYRYLLGNSGRVPYAFSESKYRRIKKSTSRYGLRMSRMENGQSEDNRQGWYEEQISPPSIDPSLPIASVRKILSGIPNDQQRFVLSYLQGYFLHDTRGNHPLASGGSQFYGRSNKPMIYTQIGTSGAGYVGDNSKTTVPKVRGNSKMNLTTVEGKMATMNKTDEMMNGMSMKSATDQMAMNNGAMDGMSMKTTTDAMAMNNGMKSATDQMAMNNGIKNGMDTMSMNNAMMNGMSMKSATDQMAINSGMMNGMSMKSATDQMAMNNGAMDGMSMKTATDTMAMNNGMKNGMDTVSMNNAMMNGMSMNNGAMNGMDMNNKTIAMPMNNSTTTGISMKNETDQMSMDNAKINGMDGATMINGAMDGTEKKYDEPISGTVKGTENKMTTVMNDIDGSTESSTSTIDASSSQDSSSTRKPKWSRIISIEHLPSGRKWF
ncbi:Uncharacterised protein g692 [Pycnogonum litorale]